jgi:hypothetical protein
MPTTAGIALSVVFFAIDTSEGSKEVDYTRTSEVPVVCSITRLGLTSWTTCRQLHTNSLATTSARNLWREEYKGHV